MDELVRQLAGDFDGPTVDVSIVPEGDLPTELSSARAAGNLPNVVQSALVTGQNVNDQGIAETESATAVIEELGEDDFYDQSLELVSTADDGYYSVPHSIDVQALTWRRSKFEELGLPEKPTSWEEIEEVASALHDPDNNQFGIGIGSAHHRFTRQCFQPIALSNGARVFNADGEVVFDSSEMVDAMEFYAKLQRQYGIPGDHDHVPVLNAYIDEQVHFISFSSYILGLIVNYEGGSEEMARDSRAAYLHESPNGEAASGNATLFTVLTSESEGELNTSEAFTEYMFTDEPYVDWLHNNLGAFAPTRAEVFESDAYQDHPQWDLWEQALQARQDVIQNSFEVFGIVDGRPIDGIGTIKSQLLISEAVSRVIDGDDAGTVASEVADEMRNAIE